MKIQTSVLMSVFSSVVFVCAMLPCAATTVIIDNLTNGTQFKDISGTLLTAGTASGGDGAVLQLGYYSAATTMNPFAGIWMPITGPGTSYRSTIGDSSGHSDGRFYLSYLFKDSYSFVPSAGTPLAIRFYDSTSLATANYFNCVSNTNGDWNWAGGLPEPTLNLTFSLTSPTQVWQGGAASAFRTTIAVPEPSVALLAASGALLAFRRRRT